MLEELFATLFDCRNTTADHKLFCSAFRVRLVFQSTPQSSKAFLYFQEIEAFKLINCKDAWPKVSFWAYNWSLQLYSGVPFSLVSDNFLNFFAELTHSAGLSLCECRLVTPTKSQWTFQTTIFQNHLRTQQRQRHIESSFYTFFNERNWCGGYF